MKYLLIMVLILLNTLPLFSQEPKRVLVRNFSSSTLDSIEIATITNYFADEMRKNRSYRIISFDEAVTQAVQSGSTVSQDCHDAKCHETIANAIDAPYYTKGEINAIGSRYIITVSLMSVTEVTAIEAVSERASSLNQTVDLMSTIASRILKTEASYIVQFTTSPLGGTIYVDNQLLVQETPGLGELTLGEHTIKVVKDMYQEWTQTITVTEDYQVVEAVLIPDVQERKTVVTAPMIEPDPIPEVSQQTSVPSGATAPMIEPDPIPEVSQQTSVPSGASTPVRSGGWVTSPHVPRASAHTRGSVPNTQNRDDARRSQHENRQQAER